jgi:hypothetical protein
MLTKLVGRGLVVGALAGAASGALFVFCLTALDTAVGNDIAIGVTTALKEGSHQEFLLFANHRATAASVGGFSLGMLTAWTIRKLVRHRQPAPSTRQADENLVVWLIADFASTLFFGALAGVCGCLSLNLADMQPPGAFVAFVVAGAAGIAGMYGMFVGWLEGRRANCRGCDVPA